MYGDVHYDTNLESKTKYIKRLWMYNISTAVLSNAAQHAQYATVHSSSRVFNPFQEILTDIEDIHFIKSLSDEFHELLNKSKIIGCHNNNATLLLIRHIVCERMDLINYNDNYHANIHEPYVEHVNLN